MDEEFPAPWRFEIVPPNQGDQAYFDVRAANDRLVATGVSGKNVRLLTASPDIAEALEALLTFYDDKIPFTKSFNWFDGFAEARTALKKAGVLA